MIRLAISRVAGQSGAYSWIDWGWSIDSEKARVWVNSVSSTGRGRLSRRNSRPRIVALTESIDSQGAISHHLRFHEPTTRSPSASPKRPGYQRSSRILCITISVHASPAQLIYLNTYRRLPEFSPSLTPLLVPRRPQSAQRAKTTKPHGTHTKGGQNSHYPHFNALQLSCCRQPDTVNPLHKIDMRNIS